MPCSCFTGGARCQMSQWQKRSNNSLAKVIQPPQWPVWSEATAYSWKAKGSLIPSRIHLADHDLRWECLWTWLAWTLVKSKEGGICQSLESSLLPIPTSDGWGQRPVSCPVSCCEMTRLLSLLLDTSDKRDMATSLKRTAVEWASRSGLGADKCGLLRRLRSAIPLGDNLCSNEVVVEPVKAFGYVVSDIKKGSLYAHEGKLVSSTGKVTHISTATASHIPREPDEEGNQITEHMLDDTASSASSRTESEGLLTTHIEPIHEIDRKGKTTAMTSSHTNDALVVKTRTKVIHCISQAAGEVTDSVYSNGELLQCSIAASGRRTARAYKLARDEVDWISEFRVCFRGKPTVAAREATPATDLHPRWSTQQM